MADLDERRILHLEGLFDAIVYGDVLEHLSDPLRRAGGAQPEPRRRAAASSSPCPTSPISGSGSRSSLGRFDYADRGILDRTHLRFFTRRTLRRASWATPGSTVEELVATPVPLPLVVPAALSRSVARRACMAASAARRAGLEGRPRLSVRRDVPACAAGGSCRRRHRRRAPDPPKVVVVMPAYNAGRTLRLTYEELPKDTVNLVILVDDGSTDATLEIARELGLEIFVHDRNYGYGANQKTCYTEALRAGCGHRGDGASRLPVRSHAGAQDDRAHREGRGRPGARLAAQGRRLGHPAGHAVVEVRREPLPDRGRELLPSASASPSSTPATAPSAGRCSRR